MAALELSGGMDSLGKYLYTALENNIPVCLFQLFEQLKLGHAQLGGKVVVVTVIVFLLRVVV